MRRTLHELRLYKQTLHALFLVKGLGRLVQDNCVKSSGCLGCSWLQGFGFRFIGTSFWGSVLSASLHVDLNLRHCYWYRGFLPGHLPAVLHAQMLS